MRRRGREVLRILRGIATELKLLCGSIRGSSEPKFLGEAMQNNGMRVAIVAVAALLGSAASAQQTAKIDFKSVGRAWPLSADVNKLQMVGPTNRRPQPTGPNAPTPVSKRFRNCKICFFLPESAHCIGEVLRRASPASR